MEQFPFETPREEKNNPSLKASVQSAARKALTMVGLATATAGTVQAQQHAAESKLSPHTHTELVTSHTEATPEQLAAAETFYQSERQWLINLMSDPAYKERLEKEGLTQADLEKRLRNILSTPLTVEHVLRPYVAGTEQEPINAQYVPGDRVHPREIQLPPIGYDNVDNMGMAIHEGQHSVTNGEDEMSAYAKELYEKAYVQGEEQDRLADSLLTMPGIVLHKNEGVFTLSKNAPLHTRETFERYMEINEYFGNPTELDARKKVLEYEMERLGIKKYGEPFTQKHLDELQRNHDKFSVNTMEFLDHIDPAFFIIIMNTIADVQVPDSTVHWNDIA